MRIFLKEQKQVGDVSYPSSGFYNVDRERGLDWIAQGLALPASSSNEIIDKPEDEPAAEED